MSERKSLEKKVRSDRPDLERAAVGNDSPKDVSLKIRTALLKAAGTAVQAVQTIATAAKSRPNLKQLGSPKKVPASAQAEEEKKAAEPAAAAAAAPVEERPRTLTFTEAELKTQDIASAKLAAQWLSEINRKPVCATPYDLFCVLHPELDRSRLPMHMYDLEFLHPSAAAKDPRVAAIDVPYPGTDGFLPHKPWFRKLTFQWMAGHLIAGGLCSALDIIEGSTVLLNSMDFDTEGVARASILRRHGLADVEIKQAPQGEADSVSEDLSQWLLKLMASESEVDDLRHVVNGQQADLPGPSPYASRIVAVAVAKLSDGAGETRSTSVVKLAMYYMFQSEVRRLELCSQLAQSRQVHYRTGIARHIKAADHYKEYSLKCEQRIVQCKAVIANLLLDLEEHALEARAGLQLMEHVVSEAGSAAMKEADHEFPGQAAHILDGIQRRAEDRSQATVAETTFAHFSAGPHNPFVDMLVPYAAIRQQSEGADASEGGHRGVQWSLNRWKHYEGSPAAMVRDLFCCTYLRSDTTAVEFEPALRFCYREAASKFPSRTAAQDPADDDPGAGGAAAAGLDLGQPDEKKNALAQEDAIRAASGAGAFERDGGFLEDNPMGGAVEELLDSLARESLGSEEHDIEAMVAVIESMLQIRSRLLRNDGYGTDSGDEKEPEQHPGQHAQKDWRMETARKEAVVVFQCPICSASCWTLRSLAKPTATLFCGWNVCQRLGPHDPGFLSHMQYNRPFRKIDIGTVGELEASGSAALRALRSTELDDQLASLAMCTLTFTRTGDSDWLGHLYRHLTASELKDKLEPEPVLEMGNLHHSLSWLTARNMDWHHGSLSRAFEDELAALDTQVGVQTLLKASPLARNPAQMAQLVNPRRELLARAMALFLSGLSRRMLELMTQDEVDRVIAPYCKIPRGTPDYLRETGNIPWIDARDFRYMCRLAGAVITTEALKHPRAGYQDWWVNLGRLLNSNSETDMEVVERYGYLHTEAALALAKQSVDRLRHVQDVIGSANEHAPQGPLHTYLESLVEGRAPAPPGHAEPFALMSQGTMAARLMTHTARYRLRSYLIATGVGGRMNTLDLYNAAMGWNTSIGGSSYVVTSLLSEPLPFVVGNPHRSRVLLPRSRRVQRHIDDDMQQLELQARELIGRHHAFVAAKTKLEQAMATVQLGWTHDTSTASDLVQRLAGASAFDDVPASRRRARRHRPAVASEFIDDDAEESADDELVGWEEKEEEEEDEDEDSKVEDAEIRELLGGTQPGLAEAKTKADDDEAFGAAGAPIKSRADHAAWNAVHAAYDRVSEGVASAQDRCFLTMAVGNLVDNQLGEQWFLEHDTAQEALAGPWPKAAAIAGLFKDGSTAELQGFVLELMRLCAHNYSVVLSGFLTALVEDITAHGADNAAFEHAKQALARDSKRSIFLTKEANNSMITNAVHESLAEARRLLHKAANLFYEQANSAYLEVVSLWQTTNSVISMLDSAAAEMRASDAFYEACAVAKKWHAADVNSTACIDMVRYSQSLVDRLTGPLRLQTLRSNRSSGPVPLSSLYHEYFFSAYHRRIYTDDLREKLGRVALTEDARWLRVRNKSVPPAKRLELLYRLAKSARTLKAAHTKLVLTHAVSAVDPSGLHVFGVEANTASSAREEDYIVIQALREREAVFGQEDAFSLAEDEDGIPPYTNLVAAATTLASALNGDSPIAERETRHSALRFDTSMLPRSFYSYYNQLRYPTENIGDQRWKLGDVDDRDHKQLIEHARAGASEDLVLVPDNELAYDERLSWNKYKFASVPNRLLSVAQRALHLSSLFQDDTDAKQQQQEDRAGRDWEDAAFSRMRRELQVREPRDNCERVTVAVANFYSRLASPGSGAMALPLSVPESKAGTALVRAGTSLVASPSGAPVAMASSEARRGVAGPAFFRVKSLTMTKEARDAAYFQMNVKHWYPILLAHRVFSGIAPAGQLMRRVAKAQSQAAYEERVNKQHLSAFPHFEGQLVSTTTGKRVPESPVLIPLYEFEPSPSAGRWTNVSVLNWLDGVCDMCSYPLLKHKAITDAIAECRKSVTFYIEHGAKATTFNQHAERAARMLANLMPRPFRKELTVTELLMLYRRERERAVSEAKRVEGEHGPLVPPLSFSRRAGDTTDTSGIALVLSAEETLNVLDNAHWATAEAFELWKSKYGKGVSAGRSLPDQIAALENRAYERLEQRVRESSFFAFEDSTGMDAKRLAATVSGIVKQVKLAMRRDLAHGLKPDETSLEYLDRVVQALDGGKEFQLMVSVPVADFVRLNLGRMQHVIETTAEEKRAKRTELKAVRDSEKAAKEAAEWRAMMASQGAEAAEIESKRSSLLRTVRTKRNPVAYATDVYEVARILLNRETARVYKTDPKTGRVVVSRYYHVLAEVIMVTVIGDAVLKAINRKAASAACLYYAHLSALRAASKEAVVPSDVAAVLTELSLEAAKELVQHVAEQTIYHKRPLSGVTTELIVHDDEASNSDSSDRDSASGDERHGYDYGYRARVDREEPVVRGSGPAALNSSGTQKKDFFDFLK